MRANHCLQFTANAFVIFQILSDEKIQLSHSVNNLQRLHNWEVLIFSYRKYISSCFCHFAVAHHIQLAEWFAFSPPMEMVLLKLGWAVTTLMPTTLYLETTKFQCTFTLIFLKVFPTCHLFCVDDSCTTMLAENAG